jgi:hypothetical protein
LLSSIEILGQTGTHNVLGAVTQATGSIDPEAQRGNAVLATEAGDHDPDLSSTAKCRRAACVLSRTAFSAACESVFGILSHLRSPWGYDESKKLPFLNLFYLSNSC